MTFSPGAGHQKLAPSLPINIRAVSSHGSVFDVDASCRLVFPHDAFRSTCSLSVVEARGRVTLFTNVYQSTLADLQDEPRAIRHVSISLLSCAGYYTVHISQMTRFCILYLCKNLLDKFSERVLNIMCNVGTQC